MAEIKLDNWKWRRVAVFGSLITIKAQLWYLIVRGTDIELHRIAVSGLLWLAAAILLLYVFGPLAEDIMRLRAGLGPKPPATKEG